MEDFRSKGLVRIELLIIIIILALAGITVLWSFLAGKAQARDQQRIIDVSAIQKALAVYFDVNGFYPDANSLGQPSGFENFLDHWPTSPAADGNCSVAQNQYAYSPKSNSSDFALTFCLGQKNSGISVGLHTLSSKGIQ